MSYIHVSLDVFSTLTLYSRVNYNNNFFMASPEVIVQGYFVKKLLLKLKAVLRGTICMIRFVWILLGFQISSYKSEEMELIHLLKIVSCKFYWRKLLQFCDLHVQINRIILKLNKSQTNHIIKIVPCKTAITQNSQENTCVKKILQYRCFPVKSCEILKNTYF